MSNLLSPEMGVITEITDESKVEAEKERNKADL